MIRKRMPEWWLAVYATDHDHSVSGFELLFDVLVAFNFSQVVTVVLWDPTFDGVARGVLIFLALWGCWMTFCWAANAARADAGTLRFLHLIALAGMVFLGLSMARAFTEPGLNDRILVLLAAYLAIRLVSAFALHLTPGYATMRDPLIVILAAVGTVTFITLSTQVNAHYHMLFWLPGLACEAIAALTFIRKQKVTAPRHLAERYAFIVIIGLDLCLGRTAKQMLLERIHLEQVLLVILTTVSCILMWWVYFGSLTTRAEHHFSFAKFGRSRKHPRQHRRLAVRYYSLMHVGVVGGLITFSLGLRAIASNLTASNSGSFGPPLAPLWAASLTIGLALYCAATALMWGMLRHKIPVSYLILAVLSIAATPFLIDRPALVALAILLVVAIPFLLIVPPGSSQPVS